MEEDAVGPAKTNPLVAIEAEVKDDEVEVTTTTTTISPPTTRRRRKLVALKTLISCL